MQIKNKRGDIPVTILVLMVVLICVLTILSFSYSRLTTNESFIGMGLIETINSFVNEHSFYSTTGFSNPAGNTFSSSGVQITQNGNTITGTYSEKIFPIIGSEKTLVTITYQR